MSIAALKKCTLAGQAAHKAAAMAALQRLGCLHLLPLGEEAPGRAAPSRRADEAYTALRFLAAVEGERRQLRRDPGFEVQSFIAQVLDLRQRLRETGDRRDFLEARIQALAPWGDLVFPPAETLGGTLFWFYELPHKHRPALEALSLPWQIVAQDQSLLYVALLAPDEPADDILPVPRIRTGSKPRAQLIDELEEAEIALESLRAERIALTRYLGLFRAHLSEAESEAELSFALTQTRDAPELFALQAWVPEAALPDLAALAEAHGLALMSEDPAWDETPPTLLEQPQKDQAGVDLALFYQVPHYRGWDPSRLLMGSFALFFAMIVADAGYGLVILGGLLLAWGRLGASLGGRAWRRMGLILAGSTIAYGAIVGSYFGAAPPEGGILSRLVLLDLQDFEVMMRLSILIGVAHILLAIALNARALWPRRSAIAQLGWMGAILGGLCLWLGAPQIGIAALAAGAAAILGFSSDRPITRPLDWLWRALDGLQALAGAMGAFGDILSYMRLFALGLASASLAITFNDLAAQVIAAVPGIGLLFGLLILAIGHGLNFALAMMSGVVHGLRLNFIEFFKWGLPDEGTAFRPFARKEVQE